MTKSVLILGQDPDTVDFTDPALPPGMNSAKVFAGLAVARKQLEDLGYEVEECLTDRGERAAEIVEAALKGKDFTCIVIGAGVRLPPKGLHLFETVLNAVHRHAPNAKIAFNTRPDDSGDAALRWTTA
jgi:hypothetical protein